MRCGKMDCTAHHCNWNTLQLSPTNAKGYMITPGRRETKPRRKFQQFGQYVFVQLQIGQFAFASKCADIDLVGWQVFRVSVDPNRNFLHKIWLWTVTWTDNLEGYPALKHSLSVKIGIASSNWLCKRTCWIVQKAWRCRYKQTLKSTIIIAMSQTIVRIQRKKNPHATAPHTSCWLVDFSCSCLTLQEFSLIG